MTFIEKIRMLERLHHLIRRRATGSPKALAVRLNISERNVYYLIEQLRDLGADIKYCKATSTFYFVHEFTFIYGKPINGKIEHLRGGEMILEKFFPLQYFCRVS